MRNTVIVILVLITASCEYSPRSIKEIQGGIEKIHVGNPENVFISEIFDSISYIPLKDSESHSLMSEVSKLEKVDSLFFILDKNVQKLYIYNDSGSFLKTVGRIGQGPGEYVTISDFSVDYKKKEILILDRSGRKIIKYDILGNYIDSYKIDIMATKICSLGDKCAVYTGGNDYYTNRKKELGYNLFFYNPDFMLQEKHFYHNPDYDNMVRDRVFDYNHSDSTLVYHHSICDTVYFFKEHGVNHKLVVDFGDSTLPIEAINKGNIREYINSSKYASILSVTYSSQYMFVNYSQKRRVHTILFDKAKGTMLNIDFLRNDLDDTMFAIPYPLKIVGNQAYYSKEASKLLFEHKKDSLILGDDVIKEDNNPVLVVGHLK